MVVNSRAEYNLVNVGNVSVNIYASSIAISIPNSVTQVAFISKCGHIIPLFDSDWSNWLMCHTAPLCTLFIKHYNDIITMAIEPIISMTLMLNFYNFIVSFVQNKTGLSNQNTPPDSTAHGHYKQTHKLFPNLKMYLILNVNGKKISSTQ